MTTHLVTGATGFIGTRLVAALLAQGAAVDALVRASSDRTALAALPVGAGGRLRFVVGDVNDEASLAAAIGDDVGVVYHLAAMLKAPWHRDFVRTNADGTARVAAACAGAARPPVLLAVSSVAAAGPSPEGRPRREDDAPTPVSRYGRSKLAAEVALAEAAARLPITIVRPPVVFGGGDRAALPLFQAAARGVHVVPTLGPAPQLSMIHVDDLCSALIAAASRGERVAGDGAVGRGIYFAAAAEQPGLDALGGLLGAAVGRRVRLLRLPGPLCRGVGAIGEAFGRLRDAATMVNYDKMVEATAGSWHVDASKAVQQLGFAPAAPLAQRLEETAAAYRDKGWIAGA